MAQPGPLEPILTSSAAEPPAPGDPTGSPPVERCLDCRQGLTGPYCAGCGQKAGEVRVTVWRLAADLAEAYLSLDSKLLRTLRQLVLRPGTLSREYLEGRRTRYVRPVTLYALASLVFFAMTSVSPLLRFDKVTFAIGHEHLEITQDEGGRTVTRFETRDEGPRAPPGVERRARSLLSGEDGRRRFLSAVESNVPHAAILLLPLVALLLKLFYWRPRRLYVEHVVFALHLQSFVFLVVSLALAIRWVASPGPALAITLLGSLLIYLPLAVKRTYAQGWVATAFKTALISLGYLASVLFTTAVLVSAGLWLA